MRVGGTAVFFTGMFCYFQIKSSLSTQTKPCVRGELPEGPSTSTAGLCAPLPSPDPFMSRPYWFRNKSGRLIQQSTFANKASGGSCCVWRAAPHVAVFIVSPPLKTNERFPLANIESHSGEGGGAGGGEDWKCLPWSFTPKWGRYRFSSAVWV